jgi:hypothetical protein
MTKSVINIYYKPTNLVGVHKTTHTILDSKNVVVHAVDIIRDVISLGKDTSRVQATEVECASWLKLSSVQAKGVNK